jgi:hypothetical protein
MAALQNGLCIRIALHEAVIGIESVLQGHSFSLWQRILLPKLTFIALKAHHYCSQSCAKWAQSFLKIHHTITTLTMNMNRRKADHFSANYRPLLPFLIDAILWSSQWQCTVYLLALYGSVFEHKISLFLHLRNSQQSLAQHGRTSQFKQ